jgi:hydroxyacylglutathione hydrolase
MKVADDLYAFIWRDGSRNNCNSFLINGSKRIILDPGHDHLFRNVERELAELSLSANDIDLVIATHGHPDHAEAVSKFPENALFAMSGEEYLFLKEIAGNYLTIREPDLFLSEGDAVIGDCAFQVIPSPGHSPGSIALFWPERGVLFSGDVLFRESIGRTDLPGGEGALLKKSIARLATLDVEYLMPGHGEMIVGRDAVRDNFRMIEEYWFRYLS